ncbi:unnamed protein product, partial [Meganyctiphanes norvegica]
QSHHERKGLFSFIIRTETIIKLRMDIDELELPSSCGQMDVSTFYPLHVQRLKDEPIVNLTRGCNDTVGTIKKKLEKLLAIPWNQQKLMHNNDRHLQDNRKRLDDYGIWGVVTLTLMDCTDEEAEVFRREGDDFEIKCNEGSTNLWHNVFPMALALCITVVFYVTRKE